MRTIIRKLSKLGTSLGFVGAATYLIAHLGDKLNFTGIGSLTTKRAKHTLLYRRQTSDLDVFRHIFVNKEYACLDELENVDFIVDCGAYVGYSSAYLLTHFPNSCLLAIEPDSDNFSILKKNLVRYGNRAKLLQAAVWSSSASLVFDDSKYRGGREWAKHVRECNIGEQASIRSIDISKILEQSGRQRISILKVDIEGAEGVVFKNGSGVEKWIDRVDAIAIELHDDSNFGPCSKIFLQSISNHMFQISRFGELTICIRSSS